MGLFPIKWIKQVICKGWNNSMICVLMLIYAKWITSHVLHQGNQKMRNQNNKSSSARGESRSAFCELLQETPLQLVQVIVHSLLYFLQEQLFFEQSPVQVHLQNKNDIITIEKTGFGNFLLVDFKPTPISPPHPPPLKKCAKLFKHIGCFRYLHVCTYA